MKHPYKRIKINGKCYDIHRLIMEEFLGRSLHHGEIIHHKDGNKHNNSIENLEIMTRSQHLNHHRKFYKKVKWTDEMKKVASYRTARENHPMSKITEDIAMQIKVMFSKGYRNVDIAKHFNLSRPIISQIRHGHRWA